MNSLLAPITYTTRTCASLSAEELKASATLFSENYGIYSDSHPSKAGKRIKLPVSYYGHLTEKDNYYVSFAHRDGQLLGQAYYMILDTSEGKLSWVIQLVVHEDFRRQGIAKRLLYSVWGFSGYRAWGLATSNPLTIKTLESATLRRVEPKTIASNSKIVSFITNEVEFLRGKNIKIDNLTSIVNTDFFVKHEYIDKNIARVYGEDWTLGDCPEGHEWLAITFQGQKLVDVTKERFEEIILHSEDTLRDAYSRMDMSHHSWAKNAASEVDFILSITNANVNERIADFGCGIGRHLHRIKKIGFKYVTGIDFSSENISKCISGGGSAREFILGDCRNIKLDRPQDIILCLYDVVGSFPDEKDNVRILKNIVKNLKKNGILVLSVMNMELTERIAKNKTNIYQNPRKLLKLKASNIMQSTGDVFDPQYFLIDTSSGLVFRKETFDGDGRLSSEYVIRDKRYRLEEIKLLLERVGLSVFEERYVQAGKWNIPLKPTAGKAKEILLFARKKSAIEKVTARLKEFSNKSFKNI